MESSFDKDESFSSLVCSFFKKETSTQVFSDEFCRVFKITYFVEHMRKVASVRSKEFLPAKFASILVGGFVIASIKAWNQVIELFSSITHCGGHMGIKKGYFQRCFYSPFFINSGFKKCTRIKGDFLLSQDIVSFFQVWNMIIFEIITFRNI